VSNRLASSPLEKSLIINLVLLALLELSLYFFFLFNAFHFSLIYWTASKASFEPGIGLLLVLLLEKLF
jgi:hypothetical protein